MGNAKSIMLEVGTVNAWRREQSQLLLLLLFIIGHFLEWIDA